MHTKMNKLGFVLLITIGLLSCSKKNNSGIETLIPEDATAVFAINVQQIMNKIALSGLTADNINGYVENIAKDSTLKPATSFWKGADSSGLDLKQPVYIAVSMPKDITNKTGLVRILGAVQDPAKFKNFLKKSEAVFTEDGDITFAVIDEMVLGFNKKYMVVLKDIPADALERGKQMGSAFPVKEELELTEKQIKELIKNTFANKASQSITKNKDYAKLPIGNSDLKMWIDMEYAANNNTSTDQVSQLTTRLGKDLFTKSSSATLLNFENGRVATTSQFYFNDAASKIIKNTASQEMDLSLLQNFSGKDINAIMGVSINPNMMVDIVKYLKTDGIMNIAFGEKNLNQDDVFNALTGDAIFVMSDLTEAAMSEKTPKNANMGFLVKIKDKNKLLKLLSVKEIAKMIKPEGNIYVFKKDSISEASAYMGMNDKVMIIAPSRLVVEDYLSGTKKSSFDPLILEKLKGKSGGYYINLNSIYGLLTKLQSATMKMGGMEMGTISKLVFGMFKETYMTATQFKDNYFQMDGYLVLNNTKDNSLANMIHEGVKAFLSFSKAQNLSSFGNDEEEPIKPMAVE